MVREVDIIGYLPSVLHEIKEIIAIANVEEPILETLWEQIENTLNNQFVLTANAEGLSRYEKMLKLQAGESESIETRRFRILTRYQEQPPYNYKVLKQLLDSLLGEGQYLLERNVAEKWIKVRLELTVKRQFEAVEVMLERITPQNMLLTIELRYNQHVLLKKYTHEQLKAFTHRQLREEVMP